MQELAIVSYSKALSAAYTDWLKHLYTAPEKLNSIQHDVQSTVAELINYYINVCHDQSCKKCIEINPTDHRFKDRFWHDLFPYNLYAQLFLSYEHIINSMSTNIPGMDLHHEQLVNYTLRQITDAFSPSNFPLTNPLVVNAGIQELGLNFVRGYFNYMEDMVRYINHQPPAGVEGFQVAVNLAVTPGKVIYRNRLIELIQYTPVTKTTYHEPILIIPAWIMKYYILDLSPDNSMVKYLVENGHTVFMISWKNPDYSDRDLGLSDYMELGVLSALNVINEIIPQQQVHCTGYCIGGTLLMLSAAYLATRADDRIKSITLFAAQVDFSEAGELRLFIDEDQIQALEKIMKQHGYLSGEQMASCFSMLHAQDLIWSRYIQDYLLGTRYPLSDMMAWNADTTRLPYKMHSEYLRKFYLYNELAGGKFKIKKSRLELKAINVPLFVVSTLKDHVAPWQSVYKIHNLTNTDITYVLTRGGHNSGIVSEPGHKDRSYQILKHKKAQKVLAPEVWQQQAPKFNGSWWIVWEKWLTASSADQINPPMTGSKKYKILQDAPGAYVLQH